MTKPVRLQLSQRAGFNLLELSQATNGLAAVKVAWPTRWGNPIVITEMHGMSVQAATEAHRRWLTKGPASLLSFPDAPRVTEIFAQLRGKNLACFCRLEAYCHADVLLELANRPTCEPADPAGSALRSA